MAWSRLSTRALIQIALASAILFFTMDLLVVRPMDRELQASEQGRRRLLAARFAQECTAAGVVDNEGLIGSASAFARSNNARLRLLSPDKTPLFDSGSGPLAAPGVTAELFLDPAQGVRYLEVAPVAKSWLLAKWHAFSLIAGLAALGGTYWTLWRWNQAIGSIRSTCESVMSGDFARRAAVERDDEFGDLAEAVNRLCRELDARIARLMEGNIRLSAILAGMVEGVVAVDESTKVLFANDQARRLLNMTSEQLEGKPLHESVRSYALQSLLDQPVGEMGPIRTEIVLDGDPPRVISAYAVKPRHQGGTGKILILDDVTDVRRLESIRRDFFANVSHELKTPLSAILAYVETLLSGAIDDREHNRLFLTRVQDSAVRLERLIQDLLSLSRIESGEEVYIIEDVPIHQLLDDCFKEHATAAVAKGIWMTNDQGPSQVCVRADDEGVWQIFRNLMDNAIKYTPEGGRVTVKWTADANMVQVSVSDTGIGVSQADQERLFERFYRVDKARSREMGGTGLGLAIVKHLCMAFGGQVKVQSEQGRGSTFTVFLPRGADLPESAVH